MKTPIAWFKPNGQMELGTTDLAPAIVSSTIKVANWNADLLDDQHGSYYLARANHTGTQVAATISDFSSAVTALLTDANIPNTITLDNITQITTRVHSDLQSLSADDHTMYVRGDSTGRSGGQTVIGGVNAADGLTLKPTSGASPTGLVTVDLTGAAAQYLSLQLATNLTASQVGIRLGVGQTIALGAGGRITGINVEPAVTVAGSPSAVPMLTFNFNPTVTFTATASRMRGHSAYHVAPNYNVSSGVTIAQLGASAGYLRALNFLPVFTDIPGGGAAGGTTPPVIEVVSMAPTIGAGWKVSPLTAVKAYTPAGTGTITDAVIIDIDDIAAFAGTLTNPARSLRSVGTAVRMEHAGPIKIGAPGAPNTASGLDVSGDFAMRAFGVVLANGANDDVAIGNHSFIRITGPTGAFNITSLGTPYDGKVVTLINTTAFAMTITNAAGTGTAANRIVTSTNADLVGTAANQTTVTLLYDATTARWRDIAFRA